MSDRGRHCGTSARGTDLDHTQAYRRGDRNQTRAPNLGPLTRRAHRAKTHGGWRLDQPRPGIFWWTSPSGDTYRVTPDGTTAMFRQERFRRFDRCLWESDHQNGRKPGGGQPSP